MNYRINLTAEDLTTLGAALDLLPHGKAAPIVRRIQVQINAHDAALRQQQETAKQQEAAAKQETIKEVEAVGPVNEIGAFAVAPVSISKRNGDLNRKQRRAAKSVERRSSAS